MRLAIKGEDGNRYVWDDRRGNVRVFSNRGFPYYATGKLVDEIFGVDSYCQFVEATLRSEGLS